MPERLTDARIDELLALEAKATPGEWIEGGSGNSRIYGPDGNGPEISGIIANFARHQDRSFIAASRNSIRSLLKEVRERRAAEKSCTQPMTPNDHLDLIYETAIARAEKEGKNR